MSIQTGVAPPTGPASRRLTDRARFRLAFWRAQPNPLWVREMRQSARLVRTPVLLMVVTIGVTLLIASIGGLMTGSRSPAEAGSAIFQTYFTIGYLVVALIGPALAANSIASEREGKTWEAVLLTGMRPAEIARGKFMAAYTGVAMYIIMLAPAGALPFLFGGVTAFEVFMAFVMLFVLALLGVAFGLAISSKMASLRGALMLTVLLAAPLSFLGLAFLGFGLSAAVHEVWEQIDSGYPVWLPLAYGRVPFGSNYLVFLVFLPAALVIMPAWLLYEITLANLTSVTEDRSFRLKCWYLAATVTTLVIALLPMFATTGSSRGMAAVAAGAIFLAFIGSCTVMLMGEAIGPSRRVKRALETAGPLRRLFSPGVGRSGVMQALAATIGFGAITAISALSLTGPHELEKAALFCAYGCSFSLFAIGLAAHLRARGKNAALPRILLLATLFLLTVGPFIIAAVTGLMAGGMDSTLVIAAPSPIYALAVAVPAAGKLATDPEAFTAVAATLVASASYALVGAVFLRLAATRCNSIVAKHRAALLAADQQLTAEDQALAAAQEAQQAANARRAAPASATPEKAG